MIKYIFNENREKLIMDIFDSLGENTNESERLKIIESIFNKRDIQEIKTYFENMNIIKFKKEVLENTFISGAWMIKIKIFHHQNGEIRLHLFSEKLYDNLLKWVEWEPHVHDFQWYSNVLLGEILEEWYSINAITTEEENEYQYFLKWFSWQDKVLQKKVMQYMDKKNSKSMEFLEEIKELNDFCAEYNIDLKNLSDIYTIYDSEKEYNTQNKLIEKFYKIGSYKFIFDQIRIIKQWMAYVLPAHRWHRILNETESITLFISDTTYKSQDFEKANNIFLRWHAKRIPSQQKSQKIRTIMDKHNKIDILYNHIVSQYKKVII